MKNSERKSRIRAADKPTPRSVTIRDVAAACGLSLSTVSCALAGRDNVKPETKRLVQEAARTLGCSATETFFRVALPMARPALAVGISLALLETLNDIGASEFLGVQTLTVTVSWSAHLDFVVNSR